MTDASPSPNPLEPIQKNVRSWRAGTSGACALWLVASAAFTVPQFFVDVAWLSTAGTFSLAAGVLFFTMRLLHEFLAVQHMAFVVNKAMVANATTAFLVNEINRAPEAVNTIAASGPEGLQASALVNDYLERLRKDVRGKS